MPRGPHPKPEDKKLRRNAPTFDPVDLERGETKVKAPPLPHRRKFSVQTRRWYDTWARSPQAAQFLATDWQRLHEVAFLVQDFFATDDPKLRKDLLGELRLQEAKLGATPEDRLRLRWRMRDLDEEAETAAKKPSGRKPSRRLVDPRLRLVEEGGSKP